ncbi:unnamed protein product [Rangifer tarandus platyrhynchus]|uniref:G-protein coupled receptors family 1 profile domain-containing protein n=1 Tax=Rangifer tarandus platyrhynchus TaxID=3082113 RepID=A0ABN8Z795_RANTA|nr:unnamed protein product [Rangifer tarandus platyrhynchus]
MEPKNLTRVSEFRLLGFSEEPEWQPLIFGFFLTMYLISVFGNLLIILAVSSDSHLHTPMYFFLSNLSFVDICFTSTTIPKMLWNIETQSKVITFEGCITQVYFFTLFVVLDILLLTVMAYDRFVAICHPLHYTVLMNPLLCGLLVLVSWLISVLHSLLESLMVLHLAFCTVLEIPHFFCELNQMIQLACSDTFLNNMVMYFVALLLGGGPLTGIFYSYSKIVSSIQGMTSAQGKYKAFSTCASHLSVVSLFYCTGLGVYLSSAVTHSSHSSARASVMYTVVTPMLNPFIYSLRNKDLKRGLKILFEKVTEPQEIHFLHMEPGNNTQFSEFFLLGFSEDPELQPLIFGLFFSMYLIAVFGNLLIILVTISDSHLHTPMYFFLSNLSFVDICFTSTTIPKMLKNIQTQSKVITYEGCIIQVYFYIFFAGLDDFLLTVMAYDRFVAICHPLHYTVIMHPHLCALLVLVSWIVIVLLFYCTSLGVYLSSAATHSSHSSATASVMYTVVTPMLNPFIYSLRNKDIKRALKRVCGIVGIKRPNVLGQMKCS